MTVTAKDAYGNLVSGYTYKYVATVTNLTATTTESYTIGGVAVTATTAVTAFAPTAADGTTTLSVVIPAVVDTGDGVSIQVYLNDGATTVGPAQAFTK